MLDYPSHFGLEFDPFVKNSKFSYISTCDAKEAKHRLGILTGTKGFGLLTGGPGTGKTTVVHDWPLTSIHLCTRLFTAASRL